MKLQFVCLNLCNLIHEMGKQKHVPVEWFIHMGKEEGSRRLHGPGTGPRAGPAPDNVRIRAGFRPGSNERSQKLENLGLSRDILFHKEKVVRSCAHPMLVTQSGSGNKSHKLHFLGYFHSCPLPVRNQLTNLASGTFVLFLKCQNKLRRFRAS
jgi:hypothetical protein